MLFGQYSYVPLVRTREAELAGIEQLKETVLDSCLPIIELTRSRRSKSDPQGDIQKNLARVSKLLAGRRYILDVTVEDEFSNGQTTALLNPSDFFGNWIQFVANLPDQLIPMIHISEGMSANEVRQEVSLLAENADSLAIRLDYGNAAMADVMAAVYEGVGDPNRIVTVLDAAFVRTGTHADHDDLIIAGVDAISGIAEPAGIVCLSSSFPASVKEKGYGGDSYGSFELAEVNLTKAVKEQRPNRRIYHGDYSCTHPHRYTASYGGWVPRVDVPLEESCFYYRHRRIDGGYVHAAKDVLSDEQYEDVGAWGDEQIARAAEGNPEGRSPSHWISVRVNIHITKQTNYWKAFSAE